MRNSIAISCLASLALSACTTVGPTYTEPEIPAPAQWRSPTPHSGSEAPPEDWWEQFDDPTLVLLVKTAAADNPSLSKAWASIESARAYLASIRSGLAPTLDGKASLSRSREILDSLTLDTLTTRSAGFDASWELDLFGKVRRSTEAAQALLQARVEDWHDAQVSLAAEVADNYVQYRGCQLLADAYKRELFSTQKTAEITTVSIRTGLTSVTDGMLSQASLAHAQSSLQGQRTECDLLVKSLVALTGMDEPRLLELLGESLRELPKPTAFRVESLPANVLRQRPDIAALERELAAYSAAIGAAQADLYPSISLLGSIALSSTSITSSATTWAFGPSLSIPLFDGGQRRAAVASAEADYRSALANWQQGVRNAVKEVEQVLANLDGAALRSEQAARAATDYRRYFDATQAMWRAGSTSLLTLEEARRSALSAEIEYLGLLREQVQSWIALYKAVGGGWTPGVSVSLLRHPILPWDVNA